MKTTVSSKKLEALKSLIESAKENMAQTYPISRTDAADYALKFLVSLDKEFNELVDSSSTLQTSADKPFETKKFELIPEEGSFLFGQVDHLFLEVEVGCCEYDGEDWDYATFSSNDIAPKIIAEQFPNAKHLIENENGSVTILWEYEDYPDKQIELLWEGIEDMAKTPTPTTQDDYSDLYGEDPFELTEKQKNCSHQHTETQSHTARGNDSVWTTVEMVCKDCGLTIDSQSFGF